MTILVEVFEHDGTIKWLSEEFPRSVYRNGTLTSNADFFGSALSIADLDQDGYPEIVAAPNGGPVQFTIWDHEGQLIRTVSSDLAREELPQVALCLRGAPAAEERGDLSGRGRVVQADVERDLRTEGLRWIPRVGTRGQGRRDD